MPTAKEHQPPQAPRVHGSSSAADERSVRRLGARIFADLLPGRTGDLTTSPYAGHCPGVSARKVANAEWSALR
jgi:hypothetical protein